MTITLPNPDGSRTDYTLSGAPLAIEPGSRFHSRTAYAAAHVVLDPVRTVDPRRPVLDWDATLAIRRHLWEHGFAVAEAMDTAQRGMGLSWPLAAELIRRSVGQAATSHGVIACGAGTDHLEGTEATTIAAVIDAYTLQCETVEAAGGRIILMASRALARLARGPEDYARVYGTILRRVREPVILHWLGPMFDPALAGYWGSSDTVEAMQHCLRVIRAHSNKIDGIKISLLSAELEEAMRRELPDGVRMYTGDDFHYDRLILGNEHSHSHALLGIFDAIAPVAALALQALDSNDLARYHALLAPTVSLSRHIFEAPTFHYKTGIVFLAFLNGQQGHFRMLAGAESARSVTHLVELFRLADGAGLLRDPALAVHRMQLFLQLAGAA